MKDKQPRTQSSPHVTSSPEAPELPTDKAFVLQLSRETGPSLEPFAGRVEHVASGRRVRFGDCAAFRAAVTYADGTDADYKAANALQAQYKITPLAAWAKPYTPKTPPVDANPGISMTDKPQAVILAMGTEGYFNWVAKRMCDAAPAAAADAPMLAQMAKIGIEPCKPFTLATLDPAVQAALKDVPQAALKKIEANQQSLGTTANGWIMTKGLGQYGTDYMKRAVVAAFG